ncbi:MAG: C40 family peptidase, partial [Spirochaetes bacterium]|nr:C40 family peptidase [Spirochaetota bacterium]
LEEKFTGQILDEETGLYYYNSRYYDPKIGVFISPDSIVPDPFDSQMLNRYMYVRGNPVKYTDPDGHHPLIAVGVGFAIGYLSHGAQTGEWGRTALAAGVKGAMAAHVGATFGGATAAIIGGPAGSTIGGIVGGAAGGAFGAGISGGNVGYGALAGLIGSGIGVLANQSGIPIIQEDFSSAVIGGAVGGGAGSAMAGGNFWEGFASGAAGAVGGYLGTAALGGLPDARKVAQKRQNAKNEEYASYHEENFYRGKELVKNLNTYVKGKPYVWGGGHRAAANYAGFDCSGGPIHIQRDKMGFKGISKGGMPAQSMFEQFPLTRTTLENMRPGDYIFYDYRIGYKANIMNHIAVYLGRINGKHMTFNAWINPYGNHHRSLKSLNLYGKNTFNAVVHYRRVNWMQMEVKYGW